MDILEQIFEWNTLAAWVLTLATTLVVFTALIVLRRLVTRRARAWVQRTDTDLDDLVVNLFDRTRRLFLAAVAIYAGSLVLKLPQAIGEGLRAVVVALFLVQVGLWGNGLLDYLVSRQVAVRTKDDDAAAATVLHALDFLEILRRLTEEGIELPYPTQTVLVARARASAATEGDQYGTH